MGGRKWSVLISKAKLRNQEGDAWDFMPTLQAVSKIHQNLSAWRKQTRNPVEVLLNMFKGELGAAQQEEVGGPRVEPLRGSRRVAVCSRLTGCNDGMRARAQAHDALLRMCSPQRKAALLQLLMSITQHDVVAVAVRGWIDDTAHDETDELGELLTWILSSNTMVQAASSDVSALRWEAT